MKLFKRLSVLLLVLFCVSAVTFGQDTVKIASGEWAPFVSKNLKFDGVVSRIIKEAFELEGYDVQFGYFPWKRSYQFTIDNEWHATPCWARNPEREGLFLFSKAPIAISQPVFFHLKDTNFDWEKIEDLGDYTIGGTIGYNYSDEFKQALEDGIIKVERANSDDMNVKKLLGGRFEIFPMNLDIGIELIRSMAEKGEITQEELESITWHPKPLVVQNLYLLFSRENLHLLNVFNRGFKKLFDQGKVDQYWKESQNGEYRQK